MNATPSPILPKICDWVLNKNYESHTRSQTIGNRFQFPSFRHGVKAISRESRTLPPFLLSAKPKSCETTILLDLDLIMISIQNSDLTLYQSHHFGTESSRLPGAYRSIYLDQDF